MKRLTIAKRGIRDGNVEPSELRDGLLDHRLDGGAIRNIARDGQPFATEALDFFHDVDATRFMQIVDDDSRTALRQRDRRGTSDPPARSSHQGYFVAERKHG